MPLCYKASIALAELLARREGMFVDTMFYIFAAV